MKNHDLHSPTLQIKDIVRKPFPVYLITIVQWVKLSVNLLQQAFPNTKGMI